MNSARGAREHEHVAFLTWGTVLDVGEPTNSSRVRLAAGPGWALTYHGAYEFAGPEAVNALPGGPEWLASIDGEAADQRHLAVHRGHAVALNDADDAAWTTGGHALVPDVTLTGTADEIRSRLVGYQGQGVDEVVFQPCGPDVERELERFIDAASGM